MIETAAGIAQFWYGIHYQEKIAPALSIEQKRELAKKISDLTLWEPFQFTGKDYSKKFPELRPFVTRGVELSGLYLAAILEGLVSDIQEAAR